MITNTGITFTKMHGTGNDFLILDLVSLDKLRHFEKRVIAENRPNWVQKVCDRHFGVGADGFVFLESSDTHDFQWDFYNSDGSSAEMCGNAARCVAAFARDRNIAGSQMQFQTRAGTIRANVNDSRHLVTIEIPKVQQESENGISHNGKAFQWQKINSGVPHSVLMVSAQTELQCEDHHELAQVVRSHSSHGPDGSNVTFYQPIDDDSIRTVSFERGVEDFTLACGTGVLAAGFHFCQSKGISSCQVEAPGGQLSVEFAENQTAKLTGPVQYICEVLPNQELF